MEFFPSRLAKPEGKSGMILSQCPNDVLQSWRLSSHNIGGVAEHGVAHASLNLLSYSWRPTDWELSVPACSLVVVVLPGRVDDEELLLWGPRWCAVSILKCPQQKLSQYLTSPLYVDVCDKAVVILCHAEVNSFRRWWERTEACRGLSDCKSRCFDRDWPGC